MNKSLAAMGLGTAGSGGSGAVESVNGMTGVVVLTADDVGAQPAIPEFIQATPSATWTINHNAGFIPDVAIFDESGVEIFAAVTSSTTTTTIEFDEPIAGSARLS